MKNILILIAIALPFLTYSQDDLLDEIESEVDATQTPEYADSAFKGLKIVNFESTKLAAKGDFYFIVSHRFGSVQNGVDDFFGLDNAVTKLAFLWSINDGLNVGIARSSFEKTYGAHVKYRLVRQKTKGSPVTIVGYNLVTANTELSSQFLPRLEFKNRLSYTSQILISRKFNKNFSLQFSPSYVHENLVSFADQDNDQFLLGFGGRHKLSKRWSINADYAWHLNRADNSPFRNALSVGFDLETGGHVFQLHFTNAQQMFEDGFLANAAGDWADGNFFFGFNISRVF